MKDIIILGIETSCDETSASVVKNGRVVLSNVISSQIDLHQKYGGVVPEIASRKHVELIIPVVDDALKGAGINLDQVDGIGVTYGPGLVGALLVGVSAAKALAFTMDKPLIGVHHIEGHIAANYIEHIDLEPPFVCLIVSGGHSHIVYVEDYNKFEILGKTRDDAAGEAFDKVARTLGMGYPGGPLVDKAAKLGNPNKINFPRVYFEKGNLDFSFSGIKTAVLNYINIMDQKGESYRIEDVCASFQFAVVEVLINNLMTAVKLKKCNKVALAGGVAANSCLREALTDNAQKNNFSAYYPKPLFCTDNAAMIASSAYYQFINGYNSDLYLNAIPSLKIGSR
ncbi:UNVERIFIED_CONTAM: N6-L-threonylcarbamoyladenine synthase [Acetivibrio alkalicellulosi]